MTGFRSSYQTNILTSAESWLNQQTQYDLWHAEQRRKQLRVAKLAPA